jgi:uncharacterized protein (DUF2249 family)
MTTEIYLDLRGMEPPEPMEHVLEALSFLKPGQHIRMLIDREPHPLYRLLERNGYTYIAGHPEPGLVEILIRNRA